MIRAGIFVGVDQTGGLAKLNDAAAGATRMYEWAISQGMTDPPNAKLITDTNGAKVDPMMIYEAIKALVDGAGADQLMLYYAGHGVNIARNEYWLLTDAPVNSGAAVNVSGSVELARYCGSLQHVVVISDACRVAAEGIQAQSVKGMEVFPNTAATDITKPVDQFYACALGRTAAEISDPKQAHKRYKAIYTEALLDALSGKVPTLLEPRDADVQYVKPRTLKSYLANEIPTRVVDMGLETKVNQVPDAIITSDDAWLARIAVSRAVSPAPAGGGGVLPPPSSPPRPRGARRDGGAQKKLERVRDPILGQASPLPSNVSIDLLHNASKGRRALERRLETFTAAEAPAMVQNIAQSVQLIDTQFGPDHFETQCGIKVRGAKILDFFGPAANAEILGNGDLLRISHIKGQAASILLVLDVAGATLGTVIPAIQEFIAGLTCGDGELMDVAYEPSANTWRADVYKQRADEVRALRAIASSASLHGRFRLDKSDAAEIGPKMQYAKSIDPTLAVYAAYAYHDLGDVKRIREMSGYLKGDIGVTFFDLELLGRRLVDRMVNRDSRVVPFVPLLSQGWSLLRASSVKLHPALDGMQRSMRDSLWSLYEKSAFEKLKAALASGEVI
jgi:hypothetical protein